MYQPVDNMEAYCFSAFPTFDHHLVYKDSSQGTSFTPSTISFSPGGSLISQQDSHIYQSDPLLSLDSTVGSAISGSCLTDDVKELKHKLLELENELLGSDPDTSINSAEMDNWRKMMDKIPRMDLRQILIACAKAVSDNDILRAEYLRAELSQKVSVHGEPIQRLGAYMLEGLVARYSGTTIGQKPSSINLLSHTHTLFEACPYFKFGCMSANGAIAEAMKDETRVHIIDFQIAQVTQWIILIQAFAGRPGGSPHIRITGTYDPTTSDSVCREMNILKNKLLDVARSVDVPLEFNMIAMCGSEAQLEQLGVRPGEALAVNFAYMLHHMPDESVNTQNHRDRLLRLVKSLSPKVVTLVEQESNTNTAPFFPRFLETLNYYTAVFETIEMSFSRGDKKRIDIEQHCLARDVVDIIAFEGDRRVERQEPLGKWRSRFSMAGFTQYPLSSYVNVTIKDILLCNYSSKYRVEERNGALYLGWMGRDLVVACAWK